jgi:predicted LPLAT superfamily acyltransferase
VSDAVPVTRDRFTCCVLVPTYDNPLTVRAVVEAAREHVTDVIVVDDGSGPAARATCEALAADGLAIVVHRERNGGKGAAVKTGFAAARERGFTHVLQIDADGQHDPGAIPRFLELGRTTPDAFVVGYPEYDASAPALRRNARKFTRFWVDLEIGRGVIRDTMIGFRVYPLAAVERIRVAGNRMDFDIEIAVRLAWAGTPIVNAPVEVRYLAPEEGGVSHFQMLGDNLRFSWLHSKLCTTGCTRWGMRKVGLLPSPRAIAADDERTTWLGTAERGTVLGIQIVFVMATLFGRMPARLLVRGIALWYALFDRPARRASRQWWKVIQGTTPGFRTVYRHVLRFAQITLDRLFLLRGKTHVFEVTRTGLHHLQAAREAGRGAILLGAHLGSFEAMRAGADVDDVPLNILGHFENAKMINALMARLNPGVAARVIHIAPDSVDFIFKVQERVAAGEFVAVLGDRTGLHEKTVTVDFFGRPARFPAGPFTLAAVLKCPLLLTFGLYREPNRYDLHCEPFADRVVLPRKDREAGLRDLVQRFARRLEDYARKAPDNWFNFYDFWEMPTAATALPGVPEPAVGGAPAQGRDPPRVANSRDEAVG